MKRLKNIIVLCAGSIFIASMSLAGPLNPPAGPVTSTYKTLTEVEPRIAINLANTPGDANTLFKITQPGSYYLTGNIAGVANKSGITIAASGVTLDFNGFELTGVAGSFDGVTLGASVLKNIAVVNGSVRNWSLKGINLAILSAANCRVDRVLASGNLDDGISVGPATIVSNCSSYQNDAGIRTAQECSIINCLIYDNVGDGLIAGNLSRVTECNIHGNDRGLLLGLDVLVSGSSVCGNRTGLITGANSHIVKCTINENTASGVVIGLEGVGIEGCSIQNNFGAGISANTPSDIAELSISGCTIRGNGGAGITSEASTQVIDCMVSSNSEGIVLTSSGVIRGCTVNSNTNSGIRVNVANLVQNNMVSSNAQTAAGTAGILVTGDDNRIEGNTLVSNAQNGIRLDGAGNLVIRNTLSRTGAVITAVAGNRLAQTITNPASGFVSTDPNANFVY